MSNLQERENRRKASIVGSMTETPAEKVADSGGRGRTKEEGRELKKRVSLSVLPSLYEDIQKIAYIQRRSVSDLVEEQLRRYRQEHKDTLTEYEEIKKRKKGGAATNNCRDVNRMRFTFIKRFG